MTNKKTFKTLAEAKAIIEADTIADIEPITIIEAQDIDFLADVPFFVVMLCVAIVIISLIYSVAI